MNLNDTIVAAATAPMPAGVAVVRVSGSLAVSMACALTGRLPVDFPSGHLRFGPLCWEDRLLDRGYAVVFRAPRSFTGEDVAEFHVHGSLAVVDALLEAACRLGARPAQPGEFTYRALEHGKLDLVQAEALADLVSARSETARLAALDHLDGQLSRRLQDLRAPLLELLAEVEAHLDFPVETGDAAPDDAAWTARALQLADQVAQLRATARAGRVRLHGARVVLYGAPNAGKSTLFNALIGIDRALVDPRPGTTRDTLEVTTAPDGVLLTWVDTAGVHDAQDPVEREGTRRAQAEVAHADVVLWVQDQSSAPVPLPSPQELAVVEAPVIVRVRAQADKPTHPAFSQNAEHLQDVVVSAQSGLGLRALRDAIVAAVRGLQAEGPGTAGVAIARQRHALALDQAREALERAVAALQSRSPLELAAADLRDAADALDELVGTVRSDDVLGQVFSTFCIGK